MSEEYLPDQIEIAGLAVTVFGMSGKIDELRELLALQPHAVLVECIAQGAQELRGNPEMKEVFETAIGDSLDNLIIYARGLLLELAAEQ